MKFTSTNVANTRFTVYHALVIAWCAAEKHCPDHWYPRIRAAINRADVYTVRDREARGKGWSVSYARERG